MYSLRLVRCGVLCSMESRKQITFDLSQDALRQHYPRKETAQDPQFFKRAYKDIQRFMDDNGFERRQYSVYVSRSELTTLDVAILVQQMVRQLPWLRQCVKEITATNIGAQHSLLGLLRPDAPPAELLPPVPKKSPKKGKHRSDSRGTACSPAIAVYEGGEQSSNIILSMKNWHGGPTR